jgi:protoporphyrinogen oxidase
MANKSKAPVVIIGAGLAGLSAAHHLNKPFLILEKEKEPGGKVRSFKSNSGAIFDCTGHLLHLRQPEIISFIESLLPDAFERIQRHAAIFMEDTFLPYPFQANFHPLKRATVKECLLGFIKAWEKRGGEATDYSSFADWALATFGEGICEHFLYPYNQKLYCTAPEDMSAEWVSWSIPQPSLESVIDGALGTVQEGLGYNASFLYPKEGGIDLLPRTMSASLDNIKFESEVVTIDAAKRLVRDAAGNEYSYENLISTMPLHLLCERILDLDPAIKDAAAKLRYVNVYNINFVLKTRPDWHWQWLYLPEQKFRCYRIGISSNISSQLAPEGKATIYSEVSYLPGQKPEHQVVRREVINDLKQIGLIEDDTDIVDELLLDLDCAYVVHNHHRAAWLEKIHKHLASLNIISTGRWGEWVYGGMEDAIAQGASAASKSS